MKACITIILIIFIVPAGFGQEKSLKRGVAYGQNSLQDLQALSPGVTWWYNWYHQPEASVLNTYAQAGFDYVPMAWNGSFDKEAMRTFLQSHPEVKYILGWNEPNFLSQANMSPKIAAAKWKDIEEIADEFGLETVGPAVNYCDVCVSENGTIYSDPVAYLDAFFDACDGCRVDHIAIHSYMGNVSALQWFAGQFKKYGKPIWLTEFANWENNPTLQDQKNFLVGAVDYLEYDPDIFRYAWFTGRFEGSPHIGLLEPLSGKLTELGEIYVNMPLHDPEKVVSIPARIEAEEYNRMNGILLELTSDVSGFANVGYIAAGDWVEYRLEVPATDVYRLDLRVAAISASSLEVWIDGSLEETINLPNTGGWQTWETVLIELSFESGIHDFRIHARGPFNINWFALSNEVILSTEARSVENIIIFPNPARDEINIQAGGRIKILDVVGAQGKRYYHGEFRDTLPISQLPPGLYWLTMVSIDGTAHRERFVKH